MDRRRVVIGVSGSIAAYKAVEVVRGLQRTGAEVRVVMTSSAQKFIGEATFGAITGYPVLTDVFDRPEDVSHVELGRWADTFCVVGATASTIQRLASGSASDAVSASWMMATCPRIIAPAMHTEMWEDPAVTRNVAQLRADGTLVIEPAVGDLASGDYGVGRLADPERIVTEINAVAGPRDLEGLRVLITAGPTREPIDPVRFISNRSSGRMGMELARSAARRGADVTVVHGPVSVPPPQGVTAIAVETAKQMFDACIDLLDSVDVVVKAAAVADFSPAEPSDRKLPKSELGMHIDLEATPDIAAELGSRVHGQTLVLFAAQTHDFIEAAREKLSRKRADLVVANIVGESGTGFDSETNTAWLVDATETIDCGNVSKAQLADGIWDRVLKLRQ